MQVIQLKPGSYVPSVKWDMLKAPQICKENNLNLVHVKQSYRSTAANVAGNILIVPYSIDLIFRNFKNSKINTVTFAFMQKCS